MRRGLYYDFVTDSILELEQDQNGCWLFMFDLGMYVVLTPGVGTATRLTYIGAL